MSTPITIEWDHVVVQPAAGTDEATLVLCRSEDGIPVALRLGDGQRRALALKLIDPTDATGHIARLAFLRVQIRRLQPGERLTSRRAARLLTKHGYPAGQQEGLARRDLATLQHEGFLDRHEQDGARWYTPTPQGQEAGR